MNASVSLYTIINVCLLLTRHKQIINRSKPSLEYSRMSTKTVKNGQNCLAISIET